MLRLAFDFIITWRETRTRPNAYVAKVSYKATDTHLTGSSKAMLIPISHAFRACNI